MPVTRVKQIQHVIRSMSDKDAYITVTEWANGMGWDVDIDEYGHVCRFGLTYEAWQALQYAMLALAGEQTEEDDA